MPELGGNAGKSRCGKGRFLPSTFSQRSPDSLVNQRLRQKAYIARKTRTRKRFITSFGKAFIIKDQGKENWLPGCLDDCPLFECMASIIKDSYLESPRSRLKALKYIYFKGDPSKIKGRLPRIRVFAGALPKKTAERVAAFVGWRFPSPTDVVEMDVVKKWLKDHENMLKGSITESIDICFSIFSRYKEQSNKYFYCGYPLVSDATQAETGPRDPVDSTSNAVSEEIREVRTKEARNGPTEALRQGSLTMEEMRAEKLKYAGEVMKVAKNGFWYTVPVRSLKLALAPSCPSRFDILCTAWMNHFRDGKPSEDWCGLQKEIFEYCRLILHGETNTPTYHQLKQQLFDDFEVFELIRLEGATND